MTRGKYELSNEEVTTYRDKKAVYNRTYYTANRKKQLTYQTVYRAEHREKIMTRDAVYNAAHREQRRAYYATYRAIHSEEIATYQATRRARKADAFIEAIDRQTVFSRDGGLCGICQQGVEPANWHLDHVIPLSKGGQHSYDNVQVSHPVCNMRKGTR